MKEEMQWVTTAFAPAPPGWRAVFDTDGEPFISPVPGWLTQVEV